jgi:hypothetical protein
MCNQFRFPTLLLNQNHLILVFLRPPVQAHRPIVLGEIGAVETQKDRFVVPGFGIVDKRSHINPHTGLQRAHFQSLLVVPTQLRVVRRIEAFLGSSFAV